jgi:hypothetical protein
LGGHNALANYLPDGTKRKRRMVNLSVVNIAAVDKAANRRKFLVIKGVDMKKSTFGEVFQRQQMNVFKVISEHVEALMSVVDKVLMDQEKYPDPATTVDKAVNDFMMSLQSKMPSVLQQLEKGETHTVDTAVLERLRERLTKAIEEEKNMSENNEGVIKEVEQTKPPDVGALRKMGNALAAIFGQSMGADEATVLALTKSEHESAAPVVDEVTAARLAKAEKEQDELRKALDEQRAETKKLRDEAELRKFAEEVGEFATIGMDPSTDAQLLKSIDDHLTEDQAKRMREILKSAKVQAEAAAMFKEIGSRGAGEPTDSAGGIVAARVAALVEKSGDKLTATDAQKQVFREDRALYEQWRKESLIRV